MTLPTLTDPHALRLLSTVAGPRLRASPPDVPPTPDLLAALTDAFGPPAEASPVSDADVARAALAVAAEEPTTGAAIEALLQHESLPTYGALETVAVITAALTILQTDVSFERTPAGKWKIKLHKKAASDALLKGLAHAVIRALRNGDDKTPPRLQG